MTLASNKPDIFELLWDTVEVRGLDIRAENDRIAVKGELFLFALYRGMMRQIPSSGWSSRSPLSGNGVHRLFL